MLTSLQNPLIKQLRKLQKAKERRNQEVLLLEGTNLIEAACDRACSFSALCATPDWQEKHPQLWHQASQQAQRAELVSPEVVAAIATTVNPDGVVATMARGIWPKAPNLEKLSLGIAVERLQDPGNLGTLIRTAAATQVQGLWLSAGSVEPDNPKVLRASAGAWFGVPLATVSGLAEVVRDFQAQGGRVIATLGKAKTSFWDVDLRRPSLILLGNEAAGLSPELAELADDRVSIPVAPAVESLNVAIASALMLYEVQRQRRLGG